MADQFTEIIARHPLIVTTLQSLIDRKIVCKMEIPRTPYSWVTLLLGLERMKSSIYLLIDRVTGFEEIQSRLAVDGISLEFRETGGVPCQFRTRVIACRPRDILAELPQEIYRIQRRKYFRMEAPLGSEITFRIGSPETEEKARVKDYSADGALFFIEKGQNLGTGDILKDIHLNIPQKTGWVRFRIPQAVVRRVEGHTSYGGRDLCAIEFLEVSNQTRNSISSFVFDQQRVTIQRVRR